MKRINVSSSSLRSIGYNRTSHILEVEFNNSNIYRYYNVPADIYEALMNASSKGSYYNEYIRDAGYTYEKVSQDKK